jgi:hypothetical protein
MKEFDCNNCGSTKVFCTTCLTNGADPDAIPSHWIPMEDIHTTLSLRGYNIWTNQVDDFKKRMIDKRDFEQDLEKDIYDLD